MILPMIGMARLFSSFHLIREDSDGVLHPCQAFDQLRYALGHNDLVSPKPEGIRFFQEFINRHVMATITGKIQPHHSIDNIK